MTDAPRTRRPWRLRVTVVVALVVGAVGAASGAYAAWSAQVSATGSVTAGRVAATLDGNLASVLTNSQMTTTRSVTLTNTTAGSSTQPAQTSVRFALVSGDATLASSTTVQVWPTTAATQCTAAAAVGAGSKQATWAAGVTMTSSLVRGQSTAYCVRTTAGVGVGSETGTRSLVASATGTVSVGTFSATPPPVSATISTSGIRPYITYPGYWLKNKPYGQSLCLDVTGGSTLLPERPWAPTPATARTPRPSGTSTSRWSTSAGSTPS